MGRIGYARVSSVGQSLESQLDRLSDCDRIFQEKRSGSDGSRPELQACLDYLQEGDTLYVTKLDRLARSTADLYSIIARLDERGVAFKVLDDPTIDTESRTGKLVMGILALIAEFENDIRRERQAEGIARARANGIKFGRPQANTHEIEKRKARGHSAARIAQDLSLHRSTVYRHLNGG